MQKLASIGWREWIHLPDLGGAVVKAKIDTGARTSAIHAFEVVEIERFGAPWAEFTIHPEQRSSRYSVRVFAPMVEQREIRSSNGSTELRPVVRTTLELGGERFEIELALAQRDQMGFRLLIGRNAIRQRFLIDPSRSYRGAESREIRRALKARSARRPVAAGGMS